MITFQNKNEFVRKNINLEEDSVSTLLIPEFLIDDFRQKTKKYKGNTAIYLHSLLRRFRIITHSGMIPEPEKLKTTYQERDLHLKKVSFKPKNLDWVELGELALVFGKSRCWTKIPRKTKESNNKAKKRKAEQYARYPQQRKKVKQKRAVAINRHQ